MSQVISADQNRYVGRYICTSLTINTIYVGLAKSQFFASEGKMYFAKASPTAILYFVTALAVIECSPIRPFIQCFAREIFTRMTELDMSCEGIPYNFIVPTTVSHQSWHSLTPTRANAQKRTYYTNLKLLLICSC